MGTERQIKMAFHQPMSNELTLQHENLGFANSQAAALQRSDLEDNRTGVVRHFKQESQHSQADIDKAIQEARESQSLSLEDFRLRNLPEGLWENPLNLLLFGAGWNLLTSLDTRLCQFTELKVLDLTHNYIKELPAEIARLTNLKVLNAGYNELTALPESINELSNLQELHLHQALQHSKRHWKLSPPSRALPHWEP